MSSLSPLPDPLTHRVVSGPIISLPIFLSLPDEILSHVCAYLDCSSLLSMRMCCKILHSVTNYRHVWRELIHRFCEEYCIEPPEESLHLYSTKELERWILRRSRARSVWGGASQPRPHTRVVDLSDLNPRPDYWACYYLVPGGRWLLISYPPADEMYALDLDCTTPLPRFLFDPAEDNRVSQEEAISYSFWNGRSSSGTSFRVAGTVIYTGEPRTFIYDLKLSGHGKSSILVASRLAGFYTPGSGRGAPRVALNEQYLIEASSQPGIGDVIVVYSYNDAREQVSNFVLKPAAQFIHRYGTGSLLKFVHDNVFIFRTRKRTLCVFNIQATQDEETKAIAHSVHLLHVIPLSISSFSRIQQSPDVSYMVTASSEGVFHRVSIPRDPRKPPVVTTLGQHDAFCYLASEPDRAELGISTSLAMKDLNKIPYFLRHDIGSGPDVESCFREAEIPIQLPDPVIRSIVFSEDIGRLILFKDARFDYLYVIDLVPYSCHKWRYRHGRS